MINYVEKSNGWLCPILTNAQQWRWNAFDLVSSSFYYLYALPHMPQVFTGKDTGLFSLVLPSVAAVVTDCKVDYLIFASLIPTSSSNCPSHLIFMFVNNVDHVKRY